MWWSSNTSSLIISPAQLSLESFFFFFVFIYFDSFDPLREMGGPAVWSLKNERKKEKKRKREGSLIWFCYIALLLKSDHNSYSTSYGVYDVKKNHCNTMSLRFVQSELLLEKLMIDAKKSLNFGYKLVPNVNINRLSFFFVAVVVLWNRDVCTRMWKVWRVVQSLLI